MNPLIINSLLPGIGVENSVTQQLEENKEANKRKQRGTKTQTLTTLKVDDSGAGSLFNKANHLFIHF